MGKKAVRRPRRRSGRQGHRGSPQARRRRLPGTEPRAHAVRKVPCAGFVLRRRRGRLQENGRQPSETGAVDRSRREQPLAQEQTPAPEHGRAAGAPRGGFRRTRSKTRSSRLRTATALIGANGASKTTTPLAGIYRPAPGHTDRRGRAAAPFTARPLRETSRRAESSSGPCLRKSANELPRSSSSPATARPAHRSATGVRGACLRPRFRRWTSGVGDAAFVKKAERRLEEGRAGLLAPASRNAASLERTRATGILLAGGRARAFGPEAPRDIGVASVPKFRHFFEAVRLRLCRDSPCLLENPGKRPPRARACARAVRAPKGQSSRQGQETHRPADEPER